jgi:hypothetical protein
VCACSSSIDEPDRESFEHEPKLESGYELRAIAIPETGCLVCHSLPSVSMLQCFHPEERSPSPFPSDENSVGSWE